MRYPGLIGSFGRMRSPNVNAERTVNLYAELIDFGTPKVRANLYRTPGLYPAYGLDSGPIRALFEQDGRAFAVGGAGFYELFPNQTTIKRGVLATDGNPATISANTAAVPPEDEEEPEGGNQLFITSGGHGYIFNLTTNVLAEITDDAFPCPCLMGMFFDGYFIALNAATGAFVLSDLLDGFAWNGLDFGLESQVSDRTRAIVRTHDNLWLLGQKNAAPWFNNGSLAFPFAPVQGSLIEHGIEAPFAIEVMDNTLIWLGRDVQGGGIVWRANGYTPERISTDAIHYYLSKVPFLSNAISWSYQEEGHLFYVLYLPTAETTLVYDVTTNMWHERALWDPIGQRWLPHVARCHTYAFGHHLVGDRLSSTIYFMGRQYLTDSLTSL